MLKFHSFRQSNLCPAGLAVFVVIENVTFAIGLLVLDIDSIVLVAWPGSDALFIALGRYDCRWLITILSCIDRVTSTPIAVEI